MVTTLLKKFWLEIFLVATVLAFWTIKSQVFNDPDFGWHIKMGSLILESGIPKTDPFSYTMSDFPFIDHEWLTGILILKVFSVFGIWGVSFLFSLLATVTLLINNPAKKRLFFLISFLLGALILNPIVGIKLQVLSWFLFAVLLKLLAQSKPSYYLIPFLSLIWVNLHGSFPLLILTFLLFNLTSFYQIRKINALAWGMWFLSITLTLINPYGFRIWFEVWSVITDSALKYSIQEWSPLLHTFDLGIYYSLIFVAFFVLKYFKKLTLFQVFLYLILFVLSLSSRRHVPLLLVATLPFIAQCFVYLYIEVKRYRDGQDRLLKVFKFWVLLTCAILTLQSFLIITNLLKLKSQNSPEKAIAFLKERKIVGNVFAPYSWGGLLIWQYPEKKVFVDGRMPSWRRENPSSGEKWVFKTYLELVSGEQSPTEVFEKYQISTVIYPISDQGIFLDNLQKVGFKVVYKDENALILQR